ncbi:MAG: endolytic transglycosylase MltG [Hyphomicrobiaceae bacterium]
MSQRMHDGGPHRQAALGAMPRSPSEALEPARAPEPPRGRRVRSESTWLGPVVRRLSAIFTLLLLAMVAAGGGAAFMKHVFDQPGPLAQSAIFVVPRGEGVNEIASRLEKEGVISDRRLFVASHLYFRIANRKRQVQLKAGEYEIRAHASMRQVLDVLVEGRTVQNKITIPEGLTSQQIVQRLRAMTGLTGTIDEIPPEGTLLPDTYKFARGMTRKDVIARMTAEHRKFVARAWAERKPDLPLKSLEEALILASIVEKETGRADERERVAAVFINRLRKGMRLESDPTIIYGIVGGKGSLGHPILKSQKEQRTPYNTYYIPGLPPTPICNPGRAAILATLNPATTKELFFVADGSGGHAFSETLAQHNANVVRWRKFVREMRAREAAAKEAAAKQAAARPPAPQPAPIAVPTPPAPVSPPAAQLAPPAPAPSPPAKAAVPVVVPPARQAGGPETMEVPLPVRKPRISRN